MSAERIQIERLLEVGRSREASELIAQLQGERPDDPDLSWLAARAALLDDDLEEGRIQLGNALASDPEHVGARFLLFRVEFQTRNLVVAEQIIVELIREYPEDPDFFTEYADLMMDTLNLEKARALTDEALRLAPDNRSARITDVLLSTIEGRRDRAGTQLRDLVHEDPNARSVAFTLLSSLSEQGRSREALQLCQELMRSDPENEGLIEAAIALRSQTHWLALPLRPLQRFGWAASGGIWLIAMLGFYAVRESKSPLILAAVAVYIGWAVYTWIYPPLMTRWLRARGI